MLDHWQQQDGFPTDAYFEAVVAERGIVIERHERIEDWDFVVELDRSGYEQGPLSAWDRITVVWRVDDACQPEHADDFAGYGWYWVPFRNDQDALGADVRDFAVPFLAEPGQVADAVGTLLSTGS